MTLLTNAEVVELRGGDRLEAVGRRPRGRGRQEIPADLLLVSIGQVPDVRGVAAWEVGIEGPRVQVDTSMATGTPGVWAVGDFADYEGKVKMIATAVAEGSTAAAERGAVPDGRRPLGRRRNEETWHRGSARREAGQGRGSIQWPPRPCPVSSPQR